MPIAHKKTDAKNPTATADAKAKKSAARATATQSAASAKPKATATAKTERATTAAKTAPTRKTATTAAKKSGGLTISASAQDISLQRSDCLVLLCASNAQASADFARADAASAGQLSLRMSRDGFTGKAGQSLLLLGELGLSTERVLLLGAGDASAAQLRQAFSALQGALKHLPIQTLTLGLLHPSLCDSQLQARIASECISLLAHRADQLKSLPTPATLVLTRVSLNTTAAELAAAQQGAAIGSAIGTGVNLARQLGDLPGNICTPTYLGLRAQQLAASHKKVGVEILEEKHMKALGMGSLLSVAAGSDQPAKLIVLNYQGGNKKDAPIALVGKGVTFDTGGISLKPGAGMDEMKYDMCGAASVLGAFATVAALNLPINVVGIIAATENMPNGNATKPGDIVTSMAGLTIEVLNTDAEGRLVLCDALTYCQSRFKPKAMIDIATLTGACVIALGAHASGLFSNNESLSSALVKAGESTGDRAWPMPLWDEYQKQLESNFADLANIGGREAGSVTAACFLSRFTQNVPWAHLDVAGTAWKSGAGKGATGRPVGLLVQYLLDQINA